MTSGESGKATGARLRIVHVITRLLNGGADENTVLSCNHAAREGHEVTLVHGADTHVEILAKVDQRVQIVPLPSLVQPVRLGSDIRALGELARLFRRLRPDIVHTHTSKAGILGRIAARLVRTPVIVHGVHIVPFWNVGRREALAYRSMERVVAQTTDAFIDVSPGVRDLCLEAGVGRIDQHHVIPSGFELERFRAASPPQNWRELLSLRSDQPRPPTLVVIAAFEPRKRHLEFLAEFPRIVQRFPEVRLVLAGDGPLRPAIEQRIETLGLGANVVLTGFHPRPEQLIALADVCVLPSMREGLPRVVMQYLAGGKPVVAADLPGLHAVLDEGVNGLIAPADDLAALADAIGDLLEDDARRARLTEGAAATDLSDWDAERLGERVEAVYHEVIASRRPDPRGSGPRIAFFLTSPNGGGAERAMIAVANYLAAKDFEVEIVFGRPTGPRRDEIDPAVGVVDLGVTRLREMLRPMNAYMRSRRPDIVVSSLMACDIVMLLGARVFRWDARLLISVQNNPVEVGRHGRRSLERLWPQFIRRLYGRADCVIGISIGVAEAVAQLLDRPLESVPVIHNPAIVPGFAENLEEAPDHPWFQDDGVPVILAAGRLTPQKDFPTLLRAFALLAGHMEARLIVIGEGEERLAIEQLIEELGITDRVAVPGFVANPYAWMKAARLFVLSSRWEGFGNVLVEALACGTPVVATDCPSGPSEILGGGTYGRLVAVGDVDALALAMQEALEAPVDEGALRARGMEFTVERIAPRYQALIEGAAAR